MEKFRDKKSPRKKCHLDVTLQIVIKYILQGGEWCLLSKVVGHVKLELDIVLTKSITQHACRNPTLAKCGGEAQHLEKVRIQSPGMFRARQEDPKHLALGCSWCHWKGLEAQISKMPSHWAFGHLSPKLWAKEGPGVKLAV